MEVKMRKKKLIEGDNYKVDEIEIYEYKNEENIGGLDMKKYRDVGEWMERVEEEKGNVKIEWIK